MYIANTCEFLRFALLEREELFVQTHWRIANNAICQEQHSLSLFNLPDKQKKNLYKESAISLVRSCVYIAFRNLSFATRRKERVYSTERFTLLTVANVFFFFFLFFSYNNFYRANVLVDRDTVYPSCPCKWIASTAASPAAWSASTAWPPSWAAALRSRSRSARIVRIRVREKNQKKKKKIINFDTHQTYSNILEGRMIELPRRAVSLPLIIHRRQYLKTRSSLELFPDSAKATNDPFVNHDRASLRFSVLLRAWTIQTLYFAECCKLCTVALR